MHALYLPTAVGSSTFTPFDAAIKCAARTPVSDFVKFSPEQTEGWLADRSSGAFIDKGALIDNGLGGAGLLELSNNKDWKAVKDIGVFRLMAQFRKLQAAIHRNISNDANVMHPTIAKLLKGDGSSTKEVRELSPEQTESWLGEIKINVSEQDWKKWEFARVITKLRETVSEAWFGTVPAKVMAVSDAFPYGRASPVSVTVGLCVLSSCRLKHPVAVVHSHGSRHPSVWHAAARWRVVPRRHAQDRWSARCG
jgi:hypothetical protein